MEELSLIEKIAIKSEIISRLDRAISPQSRLIEAFLCLFTTPCTSEITLEILKEYFTEEEIFLLETSYNSLTIPLDLWFNAMVEDILLLEGRHKLTGSDSTLSLKALNKTVIKAKLIKFLSVCGSFYKNSIAYAVQNLPKILPEYTDVVMLFSDIKYKENISMNIDKFTQYVKIFAITLLNIKPITIEEVQDLLQTKYIVEFRSVKDPKILYKRKVFDTLEDAKNFKQTITGNCLFVDDDMQVEIKQSKNKTLLEGFGALGQFF